MIIRVGTTSVQNQTLVNLRELILGEPGTYVTLSFSRGGLPSQFYEVSLLRGSPEFLDQHGGDVVRPSTTSAAPAYHAATAPSAGGNREADEIERSPPLPHSPHSPLRRSRGLMPPRPQVESGPLGLAGRGLAPACQPEVAGASRGEEWGGA